MKLLIFLLTCLTISFALEEVKVKAGAPYYHNQGIKGQGIICGILDNVDITLNDFRDPVTHKTRVLANKRHYMTANNYDRYDVWDRTRIDSLLEAKYPPDRLHPFDTTCHFHNGWWGHGTTVAGIMAGNGTSFTGNDSTRTGLAGMAPESWLVICSNPLKGRPLYFIDSVARYHNMPWVVNISMSLGPEDEINALTGQGKSGKAVVGSAGNDNYLNAHQFSFAPGDTIITIKFPGDSIYKFSGSSSGYRVEFYLIDYTSADMQVRFRTQFGEIYTYPVPYACAIETLMTSGERYETLEIQNQDNWTKFTFKAVTYRENNMYVDILRPGTSAVDSVTFAVVWKEYYAGGIIVVPTGIQSAQAADSTRIILPELLFDRSWGTVRGLGAFERIITVGISVHKSLNDSVVPVGQVAPYSCVGPSPGHFLKPDIIAPVQGMLALSVIPWDPMRRIDYVFSGTSFASPLVAGGAALLLQEDSTRDVEEIRAILADRALPNEFTGQLPNFVWGHGLFNLDPEGPAVDTVAIEDAPEIINCWPNPFNPVITIRINGRESRVNGSSSPIVQIYNINGKLIYSRTCDTRPGTRDYNLVWDASGHPSGTYIIKIRAGNQVYVKKAVYTR